MGETSSGDEIRRPRVALFVDGENCSPRFAAQIVKHAEAQGEVCLRCVIGDMTGLREWEKADGFRAIHTSAGRNSADIRLVVEAMDVASAGRADIFVIAASDTGYTHLAHYLRERGLGVIGIGEAAKAPASLRKSYSSFHALGKAAAKAATPPPDRKVDEDIRRLLRSITTDDGWIALQQFGLRLSQDYGHKLKDTGCANWTKYFRSRAAEFETKGKGDELKVRSRPG